MNYRDPVSERQLLDVIVRVLGNIGKPSRPSEIRDHIRSNKLLPKYSFGADMVYNTIINNYHAGEGVFFLSLRKGRSFGLQKWRGSPVRQTARDVAFELHTFLPKQFREAFNKATVKDIKDNDPGKQLNYLREDFIVVRLNTGFYRVVPKGESRN